MNSFVYTEGLVPQIYRESRDFKVFLKLLDCVIRVTKHDINNWLDIYDPLKCNTEFLEMLADFVGYFKDLNLTIAETRVLIKNFPQLLKNRGSLIGFKLATALICNIRLSTDPENEEYQKAVNQLEFLDIFMDHENGEIKLMFPYDVSFNKKIYDYIRPLGMTLELNISKNPEPESDMAIQTSISYTKNKVIPKAGYDDDGNYIDSESYRVNKSQVNLSQISENGKEILPKDKI